MKIKIIILVLLACLTGYIHAQTREVDAVYLKNGNVYRGAMQNTTLPGTLVIETLCSNTMQFTLEDVDHLSREFIRTGNRNSFVPNSETGYFNRTDIGALIGSGSNDKNLILGVQMVNGYKIKSRIYPGLGTGLEFFNQAFMPLYADFSYYFLNRSVSPFIRGSFGYTIPLEEPIEDWGTHTDSQGGYMYALGVGTSVRISQNNALNISLIYRFQNLRSIQTQDWTQEEIILDTQYNRIAIRVGFLFD